MKTTAKVIADSISDAGKRITTMQLCYPRFIHAEFMSHRVFSRNASSSRAIPVDKMIEQVRTNPAMPIHWGKNQAGMQAEEELSIHEKAYVIDEWRRACYHACDVAESMMQAGAHKQIVNRILEPFQHIHVIVTSTEWDNFFALRCHPDAQPEMQDLAIKMREAKEASTPRLMFAREWHLPYITEEERKTRNWALLRQISAARCCRVSYMKHDGTQATIEEEKALCARLLSANPMHASPFEHQAVPDIKVNGKWGNQQWHGNLNGWIQYRKLLELTQ